MVSQSEAAQTTPEATFPPPKLEPSDPPGPNGTDPKSPGTSKTGDVSPSSSWGFLDKLATFGRNPSAESVPITSASSADVRGSSAAPEGARTGVNKVPDEKANGSVRTFGPRTAFHDRIKQDDAHSDTETFEDAPHSFPPAIDTTSPAPTASVPGTPDFVSSDGKVPVRTVVRKRSERLRVILVSRTAGSGPSGEGVGVLNKIVEESEILGVEHLALTEGVLGFWEKRGAEAWAGLRTLNLSGCNLSVSPFCPAADFAGEERRLEPWRNLRMPPRSLAIRHDSFLTRSSKYFAERQQHAVTGAFSLPDWSSNATGKPSLLTICVIAHHVQALANKAGGIIASYCSLFETDVALLNVALLNLISKEPRSGPGETTEAVYHTSVQFPDPFRRSRSIHGP